MGEDTPRNRAERRHPELPRLLDYDEVAELLGTTPRQCAQARRNPRTGVRQGWRSRPSPP